MSFCPDQATMEGTMSDLGFKETGEPKSASFDIMNVRKSGSVKVRTPFITIHEWNACCCTKVWQIFLQLAEWENTSKLSQINGTRAVWMSGKTKVPFDIPNLLKNKTIDVVAVLVSCFMILKSWQESVHNKPLSNSTHTAKTLYCRCISTGLASIVGKNIHKYQRESKNCRPWTMQTT